MNVFCLSLLYSDKPRGASHYLLAWGSAMCVHIPMKMLSPSDGSFRKLSQVLLILYGNLQVPFALVICVYVIHRKEKYSHSWTGTSQNDNRIVSESSFLQKKCSTDRAAIKAWRRSSPPCPTCFSTGS